MDELTVEEQATVATFMEKTLFTEEEVVALAVFAMCAMHPWRLGCDLSLEEFRGIMADLPWQRNNCPLRSPLEDALHRIRQRASQAMAEKMTEGDVFAPLRAACYPQMTPIQPCEADAVVLTLRRPMPIEQLYEQALATGGLRLRSVEGRTERDWLYAVGLNTEAHAELDGIIIIPFLGGCIVENYSDQLGRQETIWQVGDRTLRLPPYTRIVLPVSVDAG